MNKLFFKIVDKIAKKRELIILDIFVYYCSYIVSKENIDNLLKNLNLEIKEKEALNSFFKIIDEEDVEVIINNLMEFVDDYDKASETLSLFFTSFIPKDILLSKDADKIKDSLKVYPKEIQEAIIKSLEMLSAVKLLNKNDKKEIIKEVIRTILILIKIIKVMDET
ncbi:hypothetical protein [Caminibacter mediatlanticus]|uniref:Uncharacterized protein n=1 Tax=Caminibacter mediatlanticus TB-2 TaxID=391592 RepID=A0AAI9F361_9BACT|nr:hypothetical protein [Caminibacter mediatlanticus]EDM24306.1 hypothetical protein CMTB2_02283 [Caminibacter mediatlanticus TB-2]